MNSTPQLQPELRTIAYQREHCRPGIIHVGVGAFHRAHQAVYMNDLLAVDGQQDWGIVGVNLRGQESGSLAKLAAQDHRYILKTMSPHGDVAYQEIGSILASYDWAIDPVSAAQVAALNTIHVISMTVTEGGYYLLEDGSLNVNEPSVVEGLEGKGSCIYTYLRAALKARIKAGGQPVTLLCCDNLRDNGHVLKSGFKQFLSACNDQVLLTWVEQSVRFPCCMVDRITPRMDPIHATDVQQRFGVDDQLTIMGETFTQWVIEDDFAGNFPPVQLVGAELVDHVAPYEDAKIRILNAGHTIVCYMAALKGYNTFDEGMRDKELVDLFNRYEMDEVIPAITDSPIDLYEYTDVIRERFSNSNIADSVARICADGVSKFPIFILVTLQGSYARGVIPRNGITGVASWYVFMRHCIDGRMSFEYTESKWDFIASLLPTGEERFFAESEVLWGDLPVKHPEFVEHLLDEIKVISLRFASP